MNDVLLSPLRLSELEILIEKSVTRALNKATPPPAILATPDETKPLNVEQAAEFLGISKQTVYQNIGKIPNRKKHGRLFFYRSELAEYLNAGRDTTNR